MSIGATTGTFDPVTTTSDGDACRLWGSSGVRPRNTDVRGACRNMSAVDSTASPAIALGRVRPCCCLEPAGRARWAAKRPARHDAVLRGGGMLRPR